MNAKRTLILSSLVIMVSLACWHLTRVQASPAAVCAWQSGSGNWSDMAHWDCGTVPGDGDTAIIDGYPTVTLDVDVTVTNLTLDDGYLTGDGDLAVTQAFVMSGWSANMSGSGVTTLAASAVMTITSGSAGNPVLLRSLDNYGTVVIGGDAGNRFDIGGGVIVANKAGGVVDIQSNRTWLWYGGSSSVRPVFNNEGTITKSTSGQAYILDILLDNAGLIQVSNDGSLRTATYAQSGAVQVDHTASSLVLSGAGDINAGSTFAGSGDVVVAGTATFNGDVSVPSLVLEGIVKGSGTMTITHALDMTAWSPSLEGTGLTTIAAGATVTITGCSAGHGGIFRPLDNYGKILIGGDAGNRFDIGNDLSINNRSGGVIEIESNRLWIWYPALYTRPVINNEGTITKSTSGAAGIWDIQVNNTGLISLTNGGLSFSRSNHSGRVLFNDVDAFLDLNGAPNQIADGAVFSGPGWLYSQNGLSVSGQVTVSNLSQGSGVLKLGDPSTANLIVTGEFRRNGGDFQALNDSTLTFDGAPALLNLGLATTFDNLIVASGTLLIEANPADYATVDGTLTNRGVIRKVQAVGGAGNQTFGLTGVSVYVDTPGTLTQLQVDRYDTDHPHANDVTRTGRYWQITPSGADYTVRLTLPHNYVNHSAVTACRYTAGDWDCGRTSSSASTVTRNNVTQLSDWAIGRPPGLELDKTAIDVNGAPLLPGDLVRYTIEVTNTSTLAVDGVVLTDTIPAHATYVADSDTPEADADADPLVWSNLSFSPGQARSYHFEVTIDADAGGQTVSNSACVKQPEWPMRCTPTVTPPGGGDVIPILEFSKTALDMNGMALQEGDVILYTITITNPHAVAVTDVVVSDTIPAHTTYIADSDTPEADADTDPLVWSNLTLSPGETTTIQFSVIVNAGAVGQLIENIACLAQPGAPQTCTPPVTPPSGGVVKMLVYIPVVFAGWEPVP